jgi:hypothetical protein
MNIVTEKKCGKCGEIKPIGEFPKRKESIDGHRGTCQKCWIKHVSDWAKENPEKRKENAKKYTRNNRLTDKGKQYEQDYRKEHKAQRNDYLKEWRKNNPDKLHEQGVRAYQNNPDRTKNWLKNNPDRRKIYDKTSLAKRRGAIGKYTQKEWKDLCDKYGNICLCCKKNLPLCADHIIPVAKGGANYISNIQPLCRSCNSKKRVTIIDYRPMDR